MCRGLTAAFHVCIWKQREFPEESYTMEYELVQVETTVLSLI